jgi:L-asparagine transporter-like permease
LGVGPSQLPELKPFTYFCILSLELGIVCVCVCVCVQIAFFLNILGLSNLIFTFVWTFLSWCYTVYSRLMAYIFMSDRVNFILIHFKKYLFFKKTLPCTFFLQNDLQNRVVSSTSPKKKDHISLIFYN